jgi:hypothetical protein
MSEPAQGGVRTDSSGVDFTADIAAAKAAGEAAMAAQTATLAAAPGLGAAAGSADLPYGPNYGSGLNADLQGAPVPAAGEGFTHEAPGAPAQTDSRPTYAGPLAGDEDPFIGGQ